jgi:hypothetical protein
MRTGNVATIAGFFYAGSNGAYPDKSVVFITCYLDT